MKEMISYGHQYIDDDDIQAVTESLLGLSLTGGKIIDNFEKDLCNYTGFKYGIVVNSGTAALHAALHAVGIKQGDEVIIPSMTFVATANVVRYMGAIPVFCDVNESLLINMTTLENMITKKTKAIISVDYGGQLVDYNQLRRICDKYNLFFISDSCHALGAIKKDSILSRPDIICYSFHPVKNITTGEGGAFLTNTSWIHEKGKAFRNHGRYEKYDNLQFDLGYNYRMPEINAALGISQLKKLDKFIERRKKIANGYINAFKNMNITLKQINENVWHLFVLKVKNRFSFIEHMKSKNINCTIHYPPVYDHPYYKQQGYSINCPYTAMIKNKIVSIPIYYSLPNNSIAEIIAIITDYMYKNEKEL